MRENKTPKSIESLESASCSNRPLSRKQILNFLTHYKEERESIRLMQSTLEKDSMDMYYPSGDPDVGAVQKQFREDKMIADILKRSQNSRIFFEKTLKDIDQLDRLLDKLIYNVNKLPGHLKYVVMATMIEQRAIEEVASEMGKSVETVSRYRGQAVNSLYYKINKLP